MSRCDEFNFTTSRLNISFFFIRLMIFTSIFRMMVDTQPMLCCCKLILCGNYFVKEVCGPRKEACPGRLERYRAVHRELHLSQAGVSSHHQHGRCRRIYHLQPGVWDLRVWGCVEMGYRCLVVTLRGYMVMSPTLR